MKVIDLVMSCQLIVMSFCLGAGFFGFLINEKLALYWFSLGIVNFVIVSLEKWKVAQLELDATNEVKQ